MAGTPAITTDFGAFPETVEHGKTGFRCRTLNEFVQAAKARIALDPQYIHRSGGGQLFAWTREVALRDLLQAVAGPVG